MSSETKPAILALADGRIFKGLAFGAERGIDNPVKGEVVFNTSLSGYQEILTDPSYAGQIMSFTCPHIGNVGCNPLDEESNRIFVEGVVVRELSRVVSNFRATQTLPEYLAARNVMGLTGIDTREIVSHLRDNGAQMGAIACGEKVNPKDLVEIARGEGSMIGRDYVKTVSCKEAYTWSEFPWSLQSNSYSNLGVDEGWTRPHVVAVDCGVKRNILRILLDVGFRVTVVPATATSQEILALNPDAIFLSNGPGDPATLDYVVRTVKDVVGRFPIFGICLGHQILGQVFGGKTYKLKFGHRGGNHPVKDLVTGKVEITVQNHGFAVAEEGLPKGVHISHINLNDRTVEGLSVPDAKAFSVQYHPEASPGPHDSRYLFRRFFELVVGYQGSK